MTINWKWEFIRAGCPNCSVMHNRAWELRSNDQSVWCHKCGWCGTWPEVKEKYGSDSSRR